MGTSEDAARLKKERAEYLKNINALNEEIKAQLRAAGLTLYEQTTPRDGPERIVIRFNRMTTITARSRRLGRYRGRSSTEVCVELYALDGRTSYRRDAKGKINWRTIIKRITESNHLFQEREEEAREKERRKKENEQLIYEELDLKPTIPYDDIRIKRDKNTGLYDVIGRDLPKDVAKKMVHAGVNQLIANGPLGVYPGVKVPKVWNKLLEEVLAEDNMRATNHTVWAEGHLEDPIPFREDQRHVSRNFIDGTRVTLSLVSDQDSYSLKVSVLRDDGEDPEWSEAVATPLVGGTLLPLPHPYEGYSIFIELV